MGLFRDFKKATQAQTPNYALAAAQQGELDMAQQQMENEVRSKNIGGAIDLYGKTTDLMEVSPITDYLRSMVGGEGGGAVIGAEAGAGAEALGMGAEALAAGGAGAEALLAGEAGAGALGLGAEALAAGGAGAAGAAGAGTGALAGLGPYGWGAMALMALLSR